jgi:hypothetical protein
MVASVGREIQTVQADACSSAVTVEESEHTKAPTLVLARSKRATLPGLYCHKHVAEPLQNPLTVQMTGGAAFAREPATPRSGWPACIHAPKQYQGFVMQGCELVCSTAAELGHLKWVRKLDVSENPLRTITTSLPPKLKVKSGGVNVHCVIARLLNGQDHQQGLLTRLSSATPHQHLVYRS